MKTSNKIILITAISVILFSIFMTFLGKMVLSDHFVITDIPVEELEIQEQTFDTKAFTSLDIQGVWRGEIIQGDAFTIQVKAPKYLLDDIIMDVNDSVLFVNLKKGSKISFESMELEVFVTLPVLESVNFLGGIDFHLSGFSQDQLDINASGAVGLSGTDMKIGNLSVTSEGASTVNLINCKITDLTLDLKSVSTITIDSMNGGNMRGSLQNGCVVNYYGEVEDILVETAGFANIIYKVGL